MAGHDFTWFLLKALPHLKQFLRSVWVFFRGGGFLFCLNAGAFLRSIRLSVKSMAFSEISLACFSVVSFVRAISSNLVSVRSSSWSNFFLSAADLHVKMKWSRISLLSDTSGNSQYWARVFKRVTYAADDSPDSCLAFLNWYLSNVTFFLGWKYVVSFVLTRSKLSFSSFRVWYISRRSFPPRWRSRAS